MKPWNETSSGILKHPLAVNDQPYLYFCSIYLFCLTKDLPEEVIFVFSVLEVVVLCYAKVVAFILFDVGRPYN